MSSQYQRSDVRQEEDILPWRRILLAALAVVIVLVLLATWGASILRAREAKLRPSRVYPEQDLGPRHEVAGVQQQLFQQKGIGGEVGLGQARNRKKHEELSRFGWADRERGLVQIPIEEAMGLVAEENRR
jgi:hypothetical protein